MNFKTRSPHESAGFDIQIATSEAGALWEKSGENETQSWVTAELIQISQLESRSRTSHLSQILPTVI